MTSPKQKEGNTGDDVETTLALGRLIFGLPIVLLSLYILVRFVRGAWGN
jgi:hypothetical protein